VILGAKMYADKSKDYLCSLFGKSRQAMYDNLQRKEETQMQGILVLSLVKEIRANHKRMGTQKLHEKLKEDFDLHHIKMGRDKFHELLAEHGLLVRQHSFKPKTTNSNHPFKRYFNLVRDFIPNAPCQLWVSDITYIRTVFGFCYLSIITDCYSHKIVGWCLWPDLTSKGVLNALEMALVSNTNLKDLIHHSDRGIQYCCHDYVRALQRNNISISMTENGDPYENALAERVNGILKMEYDLNQTFADYYQANEAVKRAVDLYNNDRPHLSIDMLTPAQAHNRTGELKKRWKSRKRSLLENELLEVVAGD